MEDTPHYINPYANTNATEERRQKDASNFQKMVQMLGMARQTDGQTMLGFAIGKLLHDWWMNRLKKESDAGRTATVKGDNTPTDPNVATKEALQQANAMQFFNVQTPQQAWESQLYGGGRSVHDRMRDDLARMSLDPSYLSQVRGSAPQASSTSSLQNYIDRQPDYKQEAANAVLPVPNFQTTVTQNKDSFTNADGQTTTHQQTTVSHPNWDAMEKNAGRQDAFSNLLKRYATLPTGGWTANDSTNYLFGR